MSMAVSWTGQAEEFIADKRMWLPCLYWSFFLDSRKTSMEAPSEDMVKPSNPDMRQVIISEEATEAQADGCSQRQITQPAGWPVSKHPAGLLHLLKGNGLLPVATRRQGAPGIIPDGSHNASTGHLRLRCEAMEGCDGCGGQLDG